MYSISGFKATFYYYSLKNFHMFYFISNICALRIHCLRILQFYIFQFINVESLGFNHSVSYQVIVICVIYTGHNHELAGRGVTGRPVLLINIIRL